MKKIILAISSIFFLSSCALLQGQNDVELDYLKGAAKLDIKKFFDGDIEGFAIVQDSYGKIIDTKSLEIHGSWDGNKGVIKKNFVSSKGKKDSRTWLITIDQDGETFTAIGHDISAPGQGKQAGNAMQMVYSLLLPGPIKGQKEKVNFQDKIYMVNKDSAIMISSSESGFEDSKKIIISLKKLRKAPVVIRKPIVVKELPEIVPAKDPIKSFSLNSDKKTTTKLEK